MIYDINVKKNIIKLYHSLKYNNNIKGQERIDIIEKAYSIHITSLYNWLNDPKINEGIDKNNIDYNIDDHINEFIINSYNKFTSIDKLKKYISQHFKIHFSYKKCVYFLKKNNLNCFNYKINNEVEKFIIDTIKIYKTYIAKDIIQLVKQKFKISISDSSIYNIYKKNNLTYKNVKINNNPYSIEEQKEHLINVNNTIENIGINKIISIDEMSIILNSKPSKGWEEKGKECILHFIFFL